MNEIPVTLVGNIVTDVNLLETESGSEVAWFRMASTPRHYDRRSQRWVDGETSFVRVSVWRSLARNVAASLSKGDPVLVTGRLRIRRWERDGRRGVSAEVDASAVGHDLSRGTTVLTRPVRGVELPEGPERNALGVALDPPGEAPLPGGSEPAAEPSAGRAGRPAA